MASTGDEALGQATHLLEQINSHRPKIHHFLEQVDTGADEDVARRRQHYDDGLDKIFTFGTACVNTFKSLLQVKKKMEQAEQNLLLQDKQESIEKDTRITELEQENEDLKGDKTGLESELQQAKEENERLKGLSDQEEGAKQKIEDLEKDKKDLESEAQQAKAENERLKELIHRQGQVDDLIRQNAQLQQQLDALQPLPPTRRSGNDIARRGRTQPHPGAGRHSSTAQLSDRAQSAFRSRLEQEESEDEPSDAATSLQVRRQRASDATYQIPDSFRYPDPVSSPAETPEQQLPHAGFDSRERQTSMETASASRLASTPRPSVDLSHLVRRPFSGIARVSSGAAAFDAAAGLPPRGRDISAQSNLTFRTSRPALSPQRHEPSPRPRSHIRNVPRSTQNSPLDPERDLEGMVRPSRDRFQVRDITGRSAAIDIVGNSDDLELFNSFLRDYPKAMEKSDDNFCETNLHVISTAFRHYGIDADVAYLQSLLADRHWPKTASDFVTELDQSDADANALYDGIVHAKHEYAWNWMRILAHRVGQQKGRGMFFRLGLATEWADGDYLVKTEPAVLDQQPLSNQAHVLWISCYIDDSTRSFYFPIADTLTKRPATASPGPSAMLKKRQGSFGQAFPPQSDRADHASSPSVSSALVATKSTSAPRKALRAVARPLAVAKRAVSTPTPTSVEHLEPSGPKVQHDTLGWGYEIEVGSEDYFNPNLVPPKLREYLKTSEHVKNHFKHNSELLTECFWSTARHAKQEHSFEAEVSDVNEAHDQTGPCKLCREMESGETRLCCVLIDENTLLWKGWGKDVEEFKREKAEEKARKKQEEKRKKEEDKKSKKTRAAGPPTPATTRSAVKKHTPQQQDEQVGGPSRRRDTGGSDTLMMDRGTQEAARAGQQYAAEESSELSNEE